MPIQLVDGCKQIEMVVHDVNGAVEFMRRTLGAERIEQKLVRRITGHVLHIDHVDCGQGMFQFCSLITDDQPHKRYIERYGPMLTNLNFSVVDQPGADRVIAAEGGRTLTSFPMADMGWENLLDPDNVRPHDEMGNGIFSETRELIGFDLEYAHPPYRDPARQDVFYPAFAQPRPPNADHVTRLLRLRAIVHDLDRTLATVQRMIDPRSRTAAYALRSDSRGRSARIRLLDFEIEYCEPAGPASPWFEYLQRFEQGLSTAVFAVADLDAVIAGMDRAELVRTTAQFIDSHEPMTAAFRLNSKHILGFDIELFEARP
ncbi:MAG: hypothetical protein CALGDGBN_01449 [Pseudomonadales bacterium]|nr:hypothetical protein [Pseudomonadales bacterium]